MAAAIPRCSASESLRRRRERSLSMADCAARALRIERITWANTGFFDASATARWNEASRPIQIAGSVSDSMLSLRSCSCSRSSSVRRKAASPAAGTSTCGRTSSRSADE